MKKNIFYAAMVSTALLLCGARMGWTAPATHQNPCSDEVSRLCGEIVPGPQGMSALMDCLEKHEKDLSPACREFESGMGGRQLEKHDNVKARRQFRYACMEDMDKFCKEIPASPGSMMNCLNGHAEELSDRCRQSIEALR